MKSERKSGGIGVLGLLGVLFVGLKLTHYIDWSWWWVTLPFWFVTAVCFGVAAISGSVWVACTCLLAIIKKRKP